MNRSQSDRQIRALVEAFVADLTALVRDAALASVQDALSPTSVSRPAASGRRAYRRRSSAPVRRRKGRGVKRARADLESLQVALLRHIQKHPGQRIEEIAPTLKASTKDLKLPVRKLIAEQAIKSKGVKRATTYFPK